MVGGLGPQIWAKQGALAAHAPRLDRALKKIAKRGGEVVLIDGTLSPTVRRAGHDNRPNHGEGRPPRVPSLPHRRGKPVSAGLADP
ncbi:hypothetical protein GA0115255_122012 [Streptomyces sp. Ncost-T6T-2b]|nr:hypothetical protein GA0115255_122012 [Streptomyces sp. Ncost-T6T-2b]